MPNCSSVSSLTPTKSKISKGKKKQKAVATRQQRAQSTSVIHTLSAAWDRIWFISIWVNKALGGRILRTSIWVRNGLGGRTLPIPIEELQNLGDRTLFTPAWAHMALGRRHDPQKQNGLQNRLTKPLTVLQQKKRGAQQKGNQIVPCRSILQLSHVFLALFKKRKSSGAEKMFPFLSRNPFSFFLFLL